MRGISAQAVLGQRMSVKVVVVGRPELMERCFRKEDDGVRVITLDKRSEALELCFLNSICDCHSSFVRNDDRLRRVNGGSWNRVQRDNHVPWLVIGRISHCCPYALLCRRLSCTCNQVLRAVLCVSHPRRYTPAATPRHAGLGVKIFWRQRAFCLSRHADVLICSASIKQKLRPVFDTGNPTRRPRMTTPGFSCFWFHVLWRNLAFALASKVRCFTACRRPPSTLATK